MPSDWNFSPDFDVWRATKLRSWRSFAEIAVQISNCKIGPLYWEPASKTLLKECHRASFELTVDLDLYDAFFNSPVGYRAHYAESERNGEAANRSLINLLIPRLDSLTCSEAKPEQIRQSLEGSQAKVWIVDGAPDEQLPGSLIFPLWEFNEPTGIGLCTPRGTKLDVKGGWLSAEGFEVIDDAKKARSGNINRTGDTR